MELETTLVDVNQTTIDDLFDETPSKTPNAEDLIGSKKTVEPEKVIDSPESTPKKTDNRKIEDKSIDDLFDTDDEPTEKVEDSKEPTDKKKVKQVAPAELDYKAVYDHYVESGKWLPLNEEELEQIEWNDESFQNLWDSQWEYQINNGVNELVDSTGDYGKAIISYVQNGGNPEEIIDLFKEQKKLQAIDVESEGGQKEAISGYYKRLGWSDVKINKHIQRLEVEGEEALKEEATEVKGLHDESIKGDVEAKNQSQLEYTREQEQKEKKFQANIINTLKKREDLTPQEKQEVHKALLTYDKKLPNGNAVNDFYLKFQEFIADPDNYVDMYQFIKDKQKFINKLEKKAETKATIKTHKFLKNGAALSNKGGRYLETETDSKEDFKFNYR